MSVEDHLEALSPDAKAAALAALDFISRPLTSIEIQDMLIGILSRRDRRAVAQALQDYALVAIIPLKS